MIRKRARNVLFMAALLLFGIFYGIHLSSSGMERVYGPFTPSWSDGLGAPGQETAAASTAAASSKADSPLSEAADNIADGGQHVQDSGSYDVPGSFIHGILDGTGRLVRHLARKMMEASVYLFEQAMD